MNHVPESVSAFGAQYKEWKNWNQLFTITPPDTRYYDGELGGFVFAGTKVLEIGFGSGAFLAWAKAKGAEVAGCELIEALCEEGNKRGYDTRAGSIEKFAECIGKFELIVALDVLEHIPLNELPRFLEATKRIMAPNASFIARTPNGSSPWGLVFQHGDITHQTCLSAGRYEQLAQQTGFKIVECRNPFRPIDPAHRMKDYIRFGLRDFITKVLSFAFQLGQTPQDSNIVVILKATIAPEISNPKLGNTSHNQE